MNKSLKSFLLFIVNILLSSVIGYILDKIGFIGMVTKSFNQNSTTVVMFLKTSIPLWEIILLFIIFVGFYFLFKKIFLKPTKSNEEGLYELEDQFKEENEFIKVPYNNTVEFNIDISFSDHQLTLHRTSPFCVNNHTRTSMSYDERIYKFYCPHCNNQFSITEQIRQRVITELETKWNRQLQLKS